jgi:hypothetical protein
MEPPEKAPNVERGQFAEAEQVHLAGLDLKPESSERWDSYAIFLDDVGRLPEAEAAHKKARHFESATLPNHSLQVSAGPAAPAELKRSTVEKEAK